jgi:hypothetical protein
MSAMDAMWNAAQRGDAFITDARMGRAQRRAAPLLAQGDYSGAAGVFGGAGFANEAMQLQQQQDRITAAEMQRQRQEAELRLKQAEEQRQRDKMDAEAKAKSAEEGRQIYRQVMQGLMRVPFEQRRARFAQLAGMLASSGWAPEGEPDDEDFTDQGLASAIIALGGEVAGPELMRFEDTVVPFDPITGRMGASQFIPMSPRAQEVHTREGEESEAKIGSLNASAFRSRSGGELNQAREQKVRNDPGGSGGRGGGGGGARQMSDAERQRAIAALPPGATLKR